VLAGGMLATATIMALGGMAQTFGQFVGSRMFLGAGGSAHAPASYSLLADFFPPKKITRAFAVLQLGFIGGTTVGVALGGKLIMALAGMPDPVILGLHVHSWQLILLGEAVAGVLAALLLLAIASRRGVGIALRPGPAAWRQEPGWAGGCWPSPGWTRCARSMRGAASITRCSSAWRWRRSRPSAWRSGGCRS
jgi:MFS family permease